MKPRKVAVTGIGVLVRDAIGVEAFTGWIMSGGGSPREFSTFDATGFRARRAYAVDPAPVAVRLADTAGGLGLCCDDADIDCAGYGLLAALEAVAMATLDADDLADAGCALATTSGGMMDRFTEALENGDDAARLHANAKPASPATIIARRLGLGGPFANFSCACASSAAALSFAYSRISTGDTPVMLAGGCDRMRQADFAGFNALRAMDRESCKPFDVARRGMVIGDGAAFLVLEDEDHARARGARPLARLAGIGLSSDSHHITAPRPDGLVRAMNHAVARAGIDPGAIGYVNCHGTGTPANDVAEVEALISVFGAGGEGPVISSTKGATGHLLGSAGALEAVITVLALQQRLAPAMKSTATPEDIPFLMPSQTEPRPFPGDYAMSNSLGFGGLNASVVFAGP